MVENVAWVVLALALLFGCMPLALTARFRAELARLVATEAPSRVAPTTAIIPCKGLDQGFEDNIRAFLNQQHPELEIVFVVALQDDPAYPVLQALLEAHARTGSSVAATVSIAGIDDRRAQKLTNQLHGLGKMRGASECIVFLDSDIRPDPTFVARLVAQLEVAGVGATTGFRWYHPLLPTWGSMLRSTWNAGALPLLTNPKTVFAFGGAMAIRRDVFVRARIGERWERALSDDFPFTLGVKELGLAIRFVPSCIAVSHESSTMAQTLEFTNRQSIISRVYFPPLWWGAAVAHSLANVFLLVGTAGAAAWLVGTGGPSASILAACLVIVPLQCINAAAMLAAVPSLLPSIADAVARLRIRYLVCAPLASMLSLCNSVWSLCTQRIVWRGVCYELVSASETRVLRRG